jgi:hypothetical protein
MADYNFLIPRVNPEPLDPGRAFFRGMLGPMQMQQMDTQNSLQEEQLKNYQERRNALAEYAKTKNLDNLAGVSPEQARIVQTLGNERTMGAWKQIEMASPTDPNQYAGIKSYLEANGVPPNWLPSPDTIKTPNDMMQFVYGGKIMAARIEQMKKGVVSLGGGVGYNTATGGLVGAPKPYQVQQGEENITIRETPNGPEILGSGPKWNPKQNQGVQFEQKPDGTWALSVGGSGSSGGKGGGAAGQLGMAPQTLQLIEKGLVDATEGLSDTNRIQKSFNPEFATIGGQWEGWKNRTKDKLGMSLSDTDKAQFEGFTGYRAEAGRVFANTLKKLSGTAVTEPEMKRQEVYLINPGTGIFDGDSPKQVQAKIAKMKDFQRMAVARLNYMRKNGLSIRNVQGQPDFGDVSLDRMPGIIKARGQQVEKKLIEGGLKPNSDELKQGVRQVISEEFGLVN